MINQDNLGDMKMRRSKGEGGERESPAYTGDQNSSPRNSGNKDPEVEMCWHVSPGHFNGFGNKQASDNI